MIWHQMMSPLHPLRRCPLWKGMMMMLPGWRKWIRPVSLTCWSSEIVYNLKINVVNETGVSFPHPPNPPFWSSFYFPPLELTTCSSDSFLFRTLFLKLSLFVCWVLLMYLFLYFFDILMFFECSYFNCKYINWYCIWTGGTQIKIYHVNKSRFVKSFCSSLLVLWYVHSRWVTGLLSLK